eukprot:GHVP01067405.1.p1 GENE.GHVP01067405.1~~GHVP01067405.1.p1  ORF type:complete len:225 (+),score=36.10 GHVP01067405.1:124-798(+)
MENIASPSTFASQMLTQSANWSEDNQVTESDLYEWFGTPDTSIPREEYQPVVESTNLSLTRFLGNSHSPIQQDFSSLGWRNQMTLNVPSSPNIFKGSIDSPPLFVQSPSGKWFAAFPIESRGHSGKLYGLVDEVEGELVPTKVYLNLGGNEKTFHEGEEEFTLGLNVQEKSFIWKSLRTIPPKLYTTTDSLALLCVLLIYPSRKTHLMDNLALMVIRFYSAVLG